MSFMNELPRGRRPSISETFQFACDDAQIPGVVLAASSDSQSYLESFGKLSLKDPNSPPMPVDATFVLASCTKLLTTIAALQCVERGLLKLDDDVSPILHELKDIEIIHGFRPDGTAILRKAKNKITLRHLLTHTSGITYIRTNPLIIKWRQARRRLSAVKTKGLAERFLNPLAFEPGTSWEYGAGLDWAGEMVSRVTEMSLQTYMQENLWEPLGINDMTFHWNQRPDLSKRRAPMNHRDGPLHPFWGTTQNRDGKVSWTDKLVYSEDCEHEFGGEGAIGSATDFLKILESLRNNDEKILRHATVEEMFRPQLSPKAQDHLNLVLSIPEISHGLGPIPLGTPFDYGLGGLLVMEDLPSGRKKGSMSWLGLPNITWWIDPASQVCGVYASQLIPHADPRSQEMAGVFEDGVYDKLAKEN